MKTPDPRIRTISRTASGVPSAALYATAALLALAGPSASDENDEQEVLLDCTANFEPYALDYGVTAINATIAPTTDTDVFVFCAAGGESVSLCLDAVGSCTGWDPLVRVFDPSNVQVGSSACATDCTFGPGSCSLCLSVSDLVPGCYTIVVSDSGTDNTGSYQLHLEEVTPTREVPVLPYSFARTVTLAPTTDNDWLRFHGKGGSTIEVEVDQQGVCTSIDPRYTLYAPDGSVVDEGACNTDCTFGPGSCSIARQVVLPMQDGLYSLRLRDGGEDDTGTMLVNVDCLFGCPPLNQFLTRNGSGVNPSTYEVVFPVVPGGCWTATVDATDQPGAEFSLILLSQRPSPIPPIPTRYGELLVDLAGPYYFDCVPVPQLPASPIARHSRRVGSSTALLGSVLRTQAVTVGAGLLRLRNAVDYVLGY